MRADDGEQAGVVPGLLNEVARAAAHGFDGDVDGAPGGHHHDGNGGVHGLDARQEIEALLAAGGVAGIVEVHQDHVEVAGFDGVEDAGGGMGGFDFEAFAF